MSAQPGPAAAGLMPGRHIVPEFAILDASSTVRRMTVKPAMCGHNSLLIGQIGDWTWETVGALCGTDVFRARNHQGDPAYLAFYYVHLKSGRALHPRVLTFGDRIEVVSRVFDFGSESVLTLHRIAISDDEPAATRMLTEEEFFLHPRPDCIYAGNFNRWVTRGRNHSNQGLVRSSPVGFRHGHLPKLSARHSPRLVYDRARTRHTFRDPGAIGYLAHVTGFQLEYVIDPSRDFNGVGLAYFAAYFSILDWALLGLWRHLGRGDRSFMHRIVLDHKVCYLGNIDVGTTLTITVNMFRRQGDPRDEVVDIVMADRAGNRTVTVSTMHLLREDHDDPAG